MENDKDTNAKIGVIVGRFQVPQLTSGHKKLIDHVLENNDEIVIFIGQCTARLDLRDPLPGDVVYSMITSYLELKLNKKGELVRYIVESLPDQSTNDYWIKMLDERIFDITSEHEDVTLYGGRDSFLNVYSPTGKYKTQFFDSDDTSEGTRVRKFFQEDYHDIKNELSKMNSYESFQAGIIHASSLLFPTSFQCVDVVAWTHSNKIVLIRKKGSPVWQLPGGFVDVTDETLEDAAVRELKEETGLIAIDPIYVLSHRINDFRYRNRRDKIMTALYSVFLEEKELLYMKAMDDAFDICHSSFDDIKCGNTLVLEDHKQMLLSWGGN